MSSPFDPTFSATEADILALEGIYVQERNPPAAIQGVALNAIGITGLTTRGPSKKVIKIGGGEKERLIAVFGRETYPSASGQIKNEIWKAILNKPFGDLHCVRVVASDSVKGTLNLLATAVAKVQVDANGEGIWANDIQVAVEAATDGDATHFNLRVAYDGNETVLQNLDTSAGNDNLLAVLGDDDANLITLTKLADGRPDNVALTSLASGADGTLADTDYTAAGTGIELLSGQKGVAAVMVAGRSNSAIKTKLLADAGLASDRMYLMCPDTNVVSQATAETEAKANPSDRVAYCFNHPKTNDPTTNTKIVTEPHAWMASVFSQTGVNDHVGAEPTKKQLAQISSVQNTISRGAAISARQAGMCVIAQDDDGHVFVSGRTTSLAPGKEEIARRRSADYILITLARALKFYVKQHNSLARRNGIKSDASGFLQEEQDNPNKNVVEGFSLDGEILNTQPARDLGIERLLTRVKLLSHILSLVVAAEIGTTVKLTEL